MIPSFTQTQNPSRMLPPPRPSPVDLVLKLAKRSINLQSTAFNNSLWSPNELKWIAQSLSPIQRPATPSNVEFLEKASRIWLEQRQAPIQIPAPSVNAEPLEIVSRTKKTRTIGPINSKNTRLWSSEEVNTLRKLYKQRLPMQQIAAQLGRSKKACSHKLWMTKPEGEIDRRVYNLSPQGQLKQKEAALALITLGQ
jgi:hypothetical protein